MKIFPDDLHPFRQATRQAVRVAAVLLVITGFSGCSRTAIGGFTDSPDKKYRVYGKVYGAYERPFMENSGKTVRISIVANTGQETLLLRSDYHVQGAEVGWDAVWDEHDNLTVIILEYPPGFDHRDAGQKTPATNRLRTMIYHFDPRAGAFHEE